jgi:transposase
MAGLLAARNAVLEAITAIDRDMKRLARASEACRRLMTIPGVGQLTALAFVAAIDEPDRFRRSRVTSSGQLGSPPRARSCGSAVCLTGAAR